MFYISPQNFPDFVLGDIGTNCLFLFGFLPELSGRKIKHNSEKSMLFLIIWHYVFLHKLIAGNY